MTIHELSDLDADALTITTRGAHTWVTCTSEGEEVTVGPFPTQKLTSALPRHTDDMDGGVTAALIEKEVEKPTAADFAKADFAVRGPDYIARHAMRCNENSPTPWQGQFGAWRDDQMAGAGWSPVRECPDPEVHDQADEGTSVDYHAMWWQAEREREKAEKERDHWKREADGANDDLAHLRAAVSRPLSPDAIDNAMTDRMLNEAAAMRAARIQIKIDRLDAIRLLTAALSEPPAHPTHAAALAHAIEQVGLTPSNPEPTEAP